jgi:hypothetical protein
MEHNETYDGCKDDKDSSNHVNDSAACFAQLERSLWLLELVQNSSTADNQDENRTGVRDVEEDGARRNERVEGNDRPKIEKSKGSVEDERDHNGSHRNVQPGVNVSKVAVIDDTLVSRHGVDESTDARSASTCAIDEANGQHCAHDAASDSASRGLEDEFHDWHACVGSDDSSRINDAEENDDDEQQSRYATNRYCVHHGSRGVLGWVWHLFRHVEDNVEADQGQSRLQKSHDPSYAVIPSRFVCKVSKDVVGAGLVGHGKKHDADDDDAEDRPVY